MATPPRLPVRIFNGLQRLREQLGAQIPRFVEAEETLLQAACRATGCDDFGDDFFLQGLRRLLRAYDEEARLSPFGRMMVRQELAGILKSRLSVQRAWNQNPAILKAQVGRPIFILGLPRTGTTVLHHLLAQDPANQVLEYWLAAAPGPRPPESEWKRDPRYKEASRGLSVMYFLDPSLKAIHLMTADGPDECRHLLQENFTDDTFDSNATIPGYTSWYRSQDMRGSYARHRDVLKLIQSGQPERRWVLKYPAHMAHLHVLLETYPDACIVQTHRDPTRVLPSLCSLVTGWRSIYEDEVDIRAVARWQVEMWAERMEHAMAVRRAGNPDQFFDFAFEELLGDPIGAIKKLYDHFGFEFSAQAETRMRDWIHANPQGKHGGHDYSAEQFGLSEGEMVARFAAYSEHFQVARESRA